MYRALTSFPFHTRGIVVDWFSRWKTGYEPPEVRARRCDGDRLSRAGRIGTEAGPSTSGSVKTNATFDSHPVEFAANPTRPAGRSGAISTW